MKRTDGQQQTRFENACSTLFWSDLPRVAETKCIYFQRFQHSWSRRNLLAIIDTSECEFQLINGFLVRSILSQCSLGSTVSTILFYVKIPGSCLQLLRSQENEQGFMFLA